MARILHGSASDRLAECRKELTLDIAERGGSSWFSIAALRRRWGIDAAQAVPTSAEAARFGSIRLFLPATWPNPLPVEPVLDALPPERLPVDGIPGEILNVLSEDVDPLDWFTHPVVLWYLDLKGLHDAIVPPRAQSPVGVFREAAWTGFLSACVLYDPPRDRLREFADGGWVPRLVAKAVHDATAPVALAQLHPDGLMMTNAPIVSVPDAEAVEVAHWCHFVEFYDFLRDYLADTLGLDINTVIEAAAADRPAAWSGVWEAFNERLGTAYTERSRFISVDADTTRQDVLDAFAILKAGFPTSHPHRPNRDTLTCAQVAIWRDEHGMSHKEIGHRLGWSVRRGRDTKPWSERIRQYAADGRAVLAQRKQAA